MLPNVPLTRRGWVLAGLVVTASVLALLFGERSLNAVVAPVVVALLAAVWQVARCPFPALDRRAPTTGTHGDRIEVTVAFEGDDLDHLCRISDGVAGGLDPVGTDRVVPGQAGLTYEVTLASRGRFWLGPATVSVRDLLGLAERSHAYDERSDLIVHPRTHHVPAPAVYQLAEAANHALERERHEFDRLREYQPTDSLRDIHWKTSAKRTDVDFVVKEFVNERDQESIVLSGEAVDGADDALAEALASLATALADAGARVGVRTVGGEVHPIRHPGQVGRILTHLATLTPGEPADPAAIHLSADTADTDEVVITVRDLAFTFGELRRGEAPIPHGPAQAKPSTEATEVAD